MRARTTLSWRILLPLAAAWLGLGALMLAYSANSNRHNADELLALRADALMNGLQVLAESVDQLHELQRMLMAMGAQEGVHELLVVAGEPLRVLASLDRAQVGMPLSQLPAHSAALIERSLSQHRSVQNRHDEHAQHEDFALPILIGNSLLTGELESPGAIYLGLDTQLLQAHLHRYLRQQTGLFMLGSALLFGLLGLLLQRQVLNPLNQLLQAIASASPLHRLQRLGRHAAGEFATLAGNLEQHYRREQEEISRLQAIFASAGECIMLIDGEGRISYANPAACRLFGYPEMGLRGQSVLDLVGNEDDLTRLQEQREALREPGGSGQTSLEISGRQRSGAGLALQVTCSRLLLGDEELFTVLMHDLRERQEAERLLHEAREAAEAASRAKSEFLATMSHELRTPMNGVIGMAQVLSQTPLSPQQGDLVDTLQHSAELLMSLLNDILDLSKIEAGMLELEQLPCDWEEILLDALQLVRASARQKDLQLLLIHPEVPTQIQADPLRLRQIVLNLLSNAIKFTRQGHIHLELRVLQQEPDRACFNLRVCDTGIGLREDQLARLFQPFTQADSSTTREFGGTGLGLSICRRLSALMHGQLEASSTVGQGSCFSLTLELPCQPLPATPAGAAPGSGKRLLLLDPQPLNREILYASLAPLGYSLLYAEHAAGELPPHDLLLLSDRLREPPPPAATPRLWLCETACNLQAYQDEPGLLRPGSRAALQAAVRQRLSGQPVATGASPAAQAHPQLHLQGKVLVVEDTEINQQVLRAMLEPCGLQLVFAGNGQQGVEATLEQHFDLILMDCLMPVLDGYQATRLIREHQRAAQLPATPIIALTANAFSESRQRCLDAGMDDFLSKPVLMADLLALLRRYLPAGPGTLAPPAAQTAPAPAKMNQPRLAQMVEQFSATVMCNLLDDFTRQARQMLDELDQALRQPDWSLAHRQAHSLKGSAGTLGLDELSRCAAALEQQLKGRADATCPPALLQQASGLRQRFEADSQQARAFCALRRQA